ILANKEANKGLHTSQPCPFPYRSSASLKVSILLIFMRSNNSCRLYSKCSQITDLTSLPIAFNVSLTRSSTKGLQPPQPVVALVLLMTSDTFLHSPLSTGRQMSPFEMLSHEQIWAV